MVRLIMLEHFDNSISNALRQTLGGSGVIYGLAFLLWLVSRKRRNYGAEVMGIFRIGFGCFKIAKVSFAPLGKKVVST